MGATGRAEGLNLVFQKKKKQQKTQLDFSCF